MSLAFVGALAATAWWGVGGESVASLEGRGVLAALAGFAVEGLGPRWGVALLSAFGATSCLTGATLALAAWPRSVLRGAAWTLAVGLLAPTTGAILATAGFLRRPHPLSLGLVVLLAAAGGSVAPDSAVLVVNAAWTSTDLMRTGAGILLGVLLAFYAPAPLRRAGLVSLLLAAGPVALLGHRAVPLPAAFLALLGSSAGWAGGGVVALAAILLVAFEQRFTYALWMVGSVTTVCSVASFMGLSPLPTALPEAATALAERPGPLLHLPVRRAAAGRTSADPWWRLLALFHGRPLVRGALPVPDDDPLLAEPGVVVLLNLLEGGAPWLIPPGDPGCALRSLGITELILDRDALTEAELARVDPVLARIYGPPQRDISGAIDLWRVPEAGPRTVVSPPYLRPTDGPFQPGWRVLDEVLAAGREGAPMLPVDGRDTPNK